MHSGGDNASAFLAPACNSGPRSKKKITAVGSDRSELEVLSEFEEELDYVGAVNGTASTGDRRYALERYKFSTQGSKLKQARSLKIYKDCIFVASPAFDELDKASRHLRRLCSFLTPRFRGVHPMCGTVLACCFLMCMPIRMDICVYLILEYMSLCLHSA